MPSALQIAHYKIADIPKDFEYVVKNFIFMRMHKQISVQKPTLDFNATDKEWYDSDKNNANLDFFKTQDEEKQEKLQKNKILLQKSFNQYIFPQPQNVQKMANSKNKSNQAHKIEEKQNKGNQPFEGNEFLKRKIIKKVLKWTPNKEKQRKIQKSYCKYLLNYLQKSNLSFIHRNIPPGLSVLETIQDGDYLKDGQRKDYPHYSNVIQPIELPSVMLQKTRIIRQPVRLEARELFFSIEDNTVFKVKHVSMLLEKIFEESIKNCTTIREMNFRGDESLRLENQNHHFDKLAEMLGLNFKTTKLLFDILNDHYDLEKELSLGRSDEYKTRVCQELKELLEKEINEYFEIKRARGEQAFYSCFTPVIEYYLSLKDLREIFLEVHSKIK